MILPDKIIRSRRRTLSISIDPFGRLIVRAPLRCGEERICAFLREKESWIVRQKEKTKGAGLRLPPESLDGYRFLLMGKECVIRLYDGTRVRYDENAREVFLRRKIPRAAGEMAEGKREAYPLGDLRPPRVGNGRFLSLPFRHVGKDAVGLLFV